MKLKHNKIKAAKLKAKAKARKDMETKTAEGSAQSVTQVPTKLPQVDTVAELIRSPTDNNKIIPLCIYVVHATSLVMRKDNVMQLTRLLTSDTRFDVKMHLMLSHDPNELTKEQLQSSVELNKFPEEHLYAPTWNPHITNMHINQVSNALKHVSCLQKIAGSESHDTVHLVIEDDVCYPPDIGDKLYNVLMQMRRGHDIVFLGFPRLDDNSDTASGMFASVPMNNLFPTCDSYFVTREAAHKLVAGCSPIRMITNKHLTFACRTKGVSPWYTLPNIFLDGSKVGRFVSTVQANNRLIYNAEYMKSLKTINDEKTGIPELRQCIIDIESSGFSNHPDIQFLKAVIHIRLEEYEAAQECFRSADEAYTKNGAMVQGDSEFLRAYMSNFKHLQ
jgi:hypothetical protein